MTVTLQEGREAGQCIGEVGENRNQGGELGGPAGVLTPSGRRSLQETAAGGKERENGQAMITGWGGGGEVGGIRWTRTEKWKQGELQKKLLFQMCWFHYFLLSLSLCLTHTHTQTHYAIRIGFSATFPYLLNLSLRQTLVKST